MASIATTFIILAFASPKKVVKSDDDITRPELRRSSSYFEAFTRNAKTAFLSLNTRAYVGLVFEGIPLLVFAIIYPTLNISIVLSVLVGVGEALVQSGIWYVAIEYISSKLNRCLYSHSSSRSSVHQKATSRSNKSPVYCSCRVWSRLCWTICWLSKADNKGCLPGN